MVDSTKSVLVIGFNTRPLTYSLKKSGYVVYAVDFFGDLDLYPNVKDSFVLLKELGTKYNAIKDNYGNLLTKYAIKMLDKYPEIDYLLIGSGLDDAFKERKSILDKIKEKNYKIQNLNNDVRTIKNARNIEKIYDILNSHNFIVPFTIPYQKFKFYKDKIQFPLIIKKFRSSGGLNVKKLEDFKELSTFINSFELKKFTPSDWLIQEYIDGIPISCTTISNGEKCEVISINHQIIGETLLNPPKDFIYCGNIVPAEISKEDEKNVSRISLLLTRDLALKGINGFDYVLKNHSPYLMEINPRIPGSITASEKSFNLNLLDLHIKSFDLEKWDFISNQIKSKKFSSYTTKLIVFAPKIIEESKVNEINHLNFIYDKTEPTRKVLKGEPLCTILFEAKNLSESYNGAKSIVFEINRIIN